jgi:hypothetical protein
LFFLFFSTLCIFLFFPFVSCSVFCLIFQYSLF